MTDFGNCFLLADPNSDRGKHFRKKNDQFKNVLTSIDYTRNSVMCKSSAVSGKLVR